MKHNKTVLWSDNFNYNIDWQEEEEEEEEKYKQSWLLETHAIINIIWWCLFVFCKYDNKCSLDEPSK